MNLYIGDTQYKTIVNGQQKDILLAPKQVNLWNMNSPNLSISNPGYNTSTISISSDGTFSIINSSNNKAARVSVTLTAADLGLVNGKQYTVKLWLLDNELGDGDSNCIYTSSTYWASGYGYTIIRAPNPCSVTFTQTNDNSISVGLICAKYYHKGASYSFRVMVAEGDHIDEYVPYKTQE